VLESRLQRKCGGSTGTNLYATLKLACEMQKNSQCGSIVTLICDSGERYLDTYYNPEWLQAHDLDPAPYLKKLNQLQDGNLDAMD